MNASGIGETQKSSTRSKTITSVDHKNRKLWRIRGYTQGHASILFTYLVNSLLLLLLLFLEGEGVGFACTHGSLLVDHSHEAAKDRHLDRKHLSQITILERTVSVGKKYQKYYKQRLTDVLEEGR